jgi:hypothetical protein
MTEHEPLSSGPASGLGEQSPSEPIAPEPPGDVADPAAPAGAPLGAAAASSGAHQSGLYPPAPVDPVPGADPDVALPPAAPGAYPDVALPPAAPGGFYVAGQPPIPPKPRRRGLAAAIAGVFVGIGALLAKFGLPVLLGAATTGLLSGAFGGPFDKIPSDQQHALEARFNTAVSDSLHGLSDAAASAKIVSLVKGGLPRLGDDLLVERLELSSRLFATTDLATCAKIARATAKGDTDNNAVASALGSMSATEIGRWFDISVSAIEAESAGAPAVRKPDQVEIERISTEVLGALDATATANVRVLYGSSTTISDTTDEQACGAVRSLYAAMAALPQADRAVMALYDVAP